MSEPSARPQASRAQRLLTKVMATDWFEPDEIAEELVVTRETLDGFLQGRIDIPVDRQLCLALFVIERVPPFARQGHQLRGQVQAAIAYHGHQTQTHTTQPPRAGW